MSKNRDFSRLGNYIGADTNGLIGIGTTGPASSLDISLSSGSTSGYRFKGYSDAGTPYMMSLGTQTYTDAFQMTLVNGYAKMGLVGAVGANPHFGLITNNIERITILSNGNVGIGMTSASATFHVLNPSGGTNYYNYMKIQGVTASNTAYPGISFVGGTYPDAPGYFPNIGLGNGGLGLVLQSGYSTVYNYPAQIFLNGGDGTFKFNSSGNLMFLIGNTNGYIQKLVVPSGGSTYEYRASKSFNENTTTVAFFSLAYSVQSSIQITVHVGSRNGGVGGYTTQIFHAVLFYSYLGWQTQYNNLSNTTGGCASYISSASNSSGTITFYCTTPNNGTSTSTNTYAHIVVNTEDSGTLTFTQL